MGEPDRVHIADVNFEEFYRPLFSTEAECKAFSDRVEAAPETQCPVKYVFHQAARLVWLGDRINEVAAGRPALQVLFYLITAETIAKLTYRFEGRDQSRDYVRTFFGKLCYDKDQVTLAQALRASPEGIQLTLQKAVDLLYDVRCDVAHRGMYYVFTLPLGEEDYPEIVRLGDRSVETRLSLGTLRKIILGGAIRSCSMIMGDEPIPPL